MFCPIRWQNRRCRLRRVNWQDEACFHALLPDRQTAARLKSDLFLSWMQRTVRCPCQQHAADRAGQQTITASWSAGDKTYVLARR
jgi:hypothetical protein